MAGRRRRGVGGRWAGIWQLRASRPDRDCQQLGALCVDSAAIDLLKINSERWQSGEEVAVWQLELFTPKQPSQILHSVEQATSRRGSDVVGHLLPQQASREVKLSSQTAKKKCLLFFQSL